MTHDPLCRPPWNYGSGGHCEGCDLIAAVRADEREQAAQRVRVATGDPDPCVQMCGKCPVCDYWRIVWRAVRAARGEA